MPVVADPEDSPRGRTEYRGRPVARTMHWSGAPWLLRETREKEENGRALRKWLDCKPGQVVCDLGAGNGYHALPLAHDVGPTGRVLAVDLQPQMLVMLADRAAEQGLTQVKTVTCSVDDPHLSPGSCDMVLMVDVYHELSHPVRVLGHVRRALTENGRVVLVEFRSEDRSVPIKPEHKMSQVQVIDELARNGFTLVEGLDSLPWQHVLAFESSETGPADEAIEDHAAREVALGWWRALRVASDRVVDQFYMRSGSSSELLATRAETRQSEVGTQTWIARLSGWQAGAIVHPQSGRTQIDFSREGGGRVRVALVQAEQGSWRVAQVTVTGIDFAKGAGQ